MNTCKNRQHLVSYFYGELPANKKKLLRNHIGKCRHCRMVLKEISRLDEGSRKIPVPHITDREWETIEERVHKKPGLKWKPVLVGASLAAAAIAAIVIIDKFTPPTETSATIAEASLTEAICVPSPSMGEGKGEGEGTDIEVLAKDSPQPRRGGPLRPPDAEGGPGITKAAAEVADTPNESPLGFQGAAAQAPKAAASGGSKPSGVVAAQPAGHIPERAVFTPTPITQKDKVVIKHNRINPSLGEKMTVSVKSDTPELISIGIYSKSGKRVRTLVEKEVPTGIHEFRWDGSNDSGSVSASGIYFIVIEAPGFKLKEKAVIIK